MLYQIHSASKEIRILLHAKVLSCNEKEKTGISKKKLEKENKKLNRATQKDCLGTVSEHTEEEPCLQNPARHRK